MDWVSVREAFVRETPAFAFADAELPPRLRNIARGRFGNGIRNKRRRLIGDAGLAPRPQTNVENMGFASAILQLRLRNRAGGSPREFEDAGADPRWKTGPYFRPPRTPP
jgi:hypothetical protein